MMQEIPSEPARHGPAGHQQVVKIKPPAAQPVALQALDHDYPPSIVGEEGKIAQSFQQYVGIIIKHTWLILGAALAFVAIGGLNGLMKTPLYTSTVTIQIDLEAVKVVDGDAAAPTRNAQGADFQRTHY